MLFRSPLGRFNSNGGDLTVDISTSGSSPDSGSAHFVFTCKNRDITGPLVTSEYHAFDGAEDLELRSLSITGMLFLRIKFNAKNDIPGQIAERVLQVRVSGLGEGANPQSRIVLSDAFVLPVTKVDSTTRSNGGTTTKTLTAAEIKLDGKVTITQPQGDISMGIYQ